MQLGTRFRCYPTAAQVQLLLQWIGCQRFIYNAKVGEDRYFRRFARQSLAHAGQHAPIDQQYSHFKTDLTPWLAEVPSQILRNGAVLWKQSYARFFKQLGGRPCIHRKTGRQSVWLTSELFEFKPVADPETGEVLSWALNLGTSKFPVGQLKFTAHQDFQPAASIHISVHAGRWYVSFNHDDGVPEPSEADTVAYLMQHTENELAAVTVGLDRGVVIPLATSDGRQFGFTPIQTKRLAAQERHKKRWERRMARRVKGGKNWAKAKHQAARYHRYGIEVRRDVAHKTSHTLVSDDHVKLLVFEDLKVKNMTRSAKGTQDAPGKNVRQKAGLNKAILSSTWGQVHLYCQYKARRAGKLTITVPAHHSSQECALCGHIHPDNRQSQAVFVCQHCGHQDHADHNAAAVTAKRGVRILLSGAYVQKPRKSCRITKHKVGAGCSKPDSALSPTPGETPVSRSAARSTALVSSNQETHATTSQV